MHGDGAAALRHVLVDVLHESQARFFLVSYLDDTHAIFLLDAEVLEGLAHDVHHLSILIDGCSRALAWHDVAMKVVEQLVFVYQVIERLSVLLFLAVLLLAEEDFAQGHEDDDSDGDDDDSHGEEGEERQGLESSLSKHLVDDQVGRRTDEREHSAQTSGKGERHEESR